MSELVQSVGFCAVQHASADQSGIIKKRARDCFLHASIIISAFLCVYLLLLIIFVTVREGAGAITTEFLTTAGSALKGTRGIAGNILNTALLVSATLAFAVPLGVGAAVYLNEYARGEKFARLAQFSVEVLAGIPSIIFGLFGMLFFGETLGLGYSIMTGALTCGIAVLPLILRSSQEALRAVPDMYRLGAAGLGAGKWYMIKTILLPAASPAIFGGVILAVGRIVGESAALIFTAGSAKYLPQSIVALFDKLFQSGGTLSVQLYLSATSEGDFPTAYGIALVLLVITLALNLTARLSLKFFGERQ